MKDKEDDIQSSADADVSADDEGKTEQDYWDEFEKIDSGTADERTFRAVTEDGENLEDDDDPDDPDEDDPDPDPDDDQDDDDDRTDNDGEADDSESSNETHDDQVARLEQQLLSEKGRAKGQQRRAEKLARRVAELEAKSKAGTDAGEDDDTDDDIRNLSEEYPEIAGPLIKKIDLLTSRLDDLSKSEADELQQSQDELDDIHATAMDTIHAEHPDGFKVIDDHPQEFQKWLNSQPKDSSLHDIFARNQELVVDGTGAAILISRFKQHRASTDSGSEEATSETRSRETRRQLQKDGANTTRSRGRQATTSAPSKDDPNEEAHWDYWERMDRKKAR